MLVVKHKDQSFEKLDKNSMKPKGKLKKRLSSSYDLKHPIEKVSVDSCFFSCKACEFSVEIETLQ